MALRPIEDGVDEFGRSKSLRDGAEVASSLVFRRPVWEATEGATHCRGCGEEFTMWLWVHHCRRCGRIRCDTCAHTWVAIPELGYTEELVRTCTDDPTCRAPPQPQQDVSFPRWVPDHEASRCRNCDAEFGSLVWKHHCRRCGQIFCDACASTFVSLPEFGYEEMVRVCNGDCPPVLPPPPALAGASDAGSSGDGAGGGDLVARRRGERSDDDSGGPSGAVSDSGSGSDTAAGGGGGGGGGVGRPVRNPDVFGDILPLELVHRILLLLDGRDVLCVEGTSRAWRDVVDNKLWKCHVIKRWIGRTAVEHLSRLNTRYPTNWKHVYWSLDRDPPDAGRLSPDDLKALERNPDFFSLEHSLVSPGQHSAGFFPQRVLYLGVDSEGNRFIENHAL